MDGATEKKRGGLLTFWLILMLIGNIITILVYLLGRNILTFLIPSWAIYIMPILALLNIVFVIFLFMWKKWAFFGFCGTTGVALVINIILGAGIFSIILGLAGPVILYLILRPKWDLLE